MAQLASIEEDYTEVRGLLQVRNQNGNCVFRQPWHNMSMTHKKKGYQKCIDCGKYKPLDQFPRSPFLKNGHNRRCKICYDDWRDEGIEAVLALPVHGTTVQEIAPDINRSKKKTHLEMKPGGRHQLRAVICKWCKEEFFTKYSYQIYCSPECRTKANISDRFIILRRDGFRCVYCGARPIDDESVVLHVDHIIPRAADGPDIADNLATACERCNLEKSARRIGEFEAELLLKIAERNRQHGIDGNTLVKI